MKEIAKKVIYWCIGLLINIKYNILKFDLGKCTYKELYRLSYYSSHILIELKRRNEERVISFLKGQVINVGFVVYTPSMWSVDALYEKMNKDPKFNVSIVVARFGMSDSASRETTFEDTKGYFRTQKGYIVETVDEGLGKYDILIYTTPGILFDKELNLFNQKISTLICHISYSFMLTDNAKKFDIPMYFLVWRFFCDSEFYKKQLKNKARIFTDNTFYLGYPKMDELYLVKSAKKKYVKTIIYAPHHSVNYEGVKSATFDVNYMKLLDIAKKYQDEIFWVVKPHPLLGDHAVQAGVFNSYHEYDEYMNQWRNLKNSAVVLSGDYMKLFVESDAMITDSISFLAEYQFTGNPLLLLESGKQKYNEFGKSILEILYKCKGDDYLSMEQFIHSVIVGEDDMRERRELFFTENLDYYGKKHKLASDIIFDFFEDIFTVQ